VLTFENDPIYNSVPSISIDEADIFQGANYSEITFCMFGCSTFIADISQDNGQSFILTNHNLTTLPSSSNYDCNNDNLNLSDVFIDNFLTDQNTQNWHQNFSYNITTPGVPFLEITNPDGVKATFDRFVVIGVDEFKKQAFRIFPNPAKNEIHIDSNTIDIQKIQILNLQGKLVLQQNRITDNKLNVSRLRSGLYIVKVTSIEGNIFSQKIIKN